MVFRHYDIEASSKPHDIVVKGVSFSQDSRFLITGAVDATYNFALLDRKEGKNLKNNHEKIQIL